MKSDVAGDGVADADLIIEAIFENADAKKELYKNLEVSMKPGAILATNTSTIRLEDLRTELREPQKFIGVHFFNPVALMPLVEIVRCEDTERDAIDVGINFVKAIGKFPLECASAPGFVVNRILAPYMTEAMHLVESGVALTMVDRAAESFGMPMGPIELVDSVGLDVVLHSSKVMGADMDSPVAQRLAALVLTELPKIAPLETAQVRLAWLRTQRCQDFLCPLKIAVDPHLIREADLRRVKLLATSLGGFSRVAFRLLGDVPLPCDNEQTGDKRHRH